MADEQPKPKVVVTRTLADEDLNAVEDEDADADQNEEVVHGPEVVPEAASIPPHQPPASASAIVLSPEAEAEVQRRNKEFGEKFLAENKQRFEEALKEIRAKLEPPKPEDIQKMLDEEYVTFKVKLPFGDGDKEFVLEELPQAIEKKFYRLVKDKLVPLTQEINSIKMNLLDGGDISKKILAMAETVEPILDVLAGVASIALNPRGKIDGINVEWVQENLSSMRILSVVNAQAQCNRLRDFFSILSRGMKSLT